MMNLSDFVQKPQMNADERRFNVSEKVQIKAPLAPHYVCGAVGLMSRGGRERTEGGWNDDATVKALFEPFTKPFI